MIMPTKLSYILDKLSIYFTFRKTKLKSHRLFDLIQIMRIFISSTDLSGSRRSTRLNIANCNNTSALIRQICKQLRVNRATVIIKLKYEPQNLRLVENWPITQYPIKNGSTFIVQFNNKQSFRDNSDSSSSLDKIEEQIDDSLSEGDSTSFQQNSFASSLRLIQGNKETYDDSTYLQQCLNKMLEAVRQGSLEQIAKIIKEEPNTDDQAELSRIMNKKLNYLLNELGDCGRNAMHWAIHINNPQIVSFLIIKGANPTVLTIDQYTPLQLAVQHHSTQIMKLLLEQKKLDINQLTKRGTALHLAVANQDMKCLELLLQNDVDMQMVSQEGKKAIDLCLNDRIKEVLQRKADFKKIITPNITKGIINRVSSHTYRLKQKNMVLNPFKDEFIIENNNKQIEEKLSITKISRIEKIEEKKWLMSDKILYFKIVMKEKDKQILFGLKSSKIYDRWINNFKASIKYLEHAVYNKPVPISEQVIQILNDQKGEISLHKRKTQSQTSTPKKTISIMNLKSNVPEEQQQIQIQSLKLVKSATYQIKHEDQQSNASQQDNFRQSQIVLGSIIQSKNIVCLSAPPKSYQYELQQNYGEQNQPSEIDTSKFKFRKNSDHRVQVVSEFKMEQKKASISYEDFEVLNILGNGAFGQVYLARYKKTNKMYALKVLNKKRLISKKQLKYAVGEANILKRVESSFIIKLYYAFQTPTNLYMALDNCSNGDLGQLLNVKQKLSQNTARFIISQLILAVQYLHKNKILYRDLKPENILISHDGYIRLTDFGLSRESNFATSFCGSPAYLSPEMLEKKGVSFSSDIYGIGCVLYEMVVGQPPFFNECLDTLFQNIKNGKLRFPSYLTIEIKSLINKLLDRDISKRLGVKDIGQIKKHDFFKKLDWKLIEFKSLKPPPEMFINEQQNPDELVLLQRSSQIRLIDNDYNQSTSMINRVKNFTFIRQPSKGRTPQKKSNQQNQR